jgi:hypothetical protein
VDLSTNEIPTTAIRTILNQVAKSYTLFQMNFQNNHVTAEEMNEIDLKLKENGSIVNFLFDEYPRQDLFLKSLINSNPKFYCQPQLQKKFCVIGKTKKFLSIDLTRLALQYPPDYFTNPMIIHWFWRPWPLQSFAKINELLAKKLTGQAKPVSKTFKINDPRKAGDMNNTQTLSSTLISTAQFQTKPHPTRNENTFGSSRHLEHDDIEDDGDDGFMANTGKHETTTASAPKSKSISITKKILFDDPFIHMLTLFSISYEVRFTTAHEELFTYEKEIDLSTLTQSEMFNDYVPWYHFYEIIPAKYVAMKKGNIEIRLKCKPTKQFYEKNYVFDSTVAALCFQLKSCIATSLLLHPNAGHAGYYYLGGDGDEHETLPLSIQESFEKETVRILYDDDHETFQDHTCLRYFQWVYGHATKKCKISWKSKLIIKNPESFTANRSRHKKKKGEDGEEEEEDEMNSTYMNRLDYHDIIDEDYWSSFPPPPPKEEKRPRNSSRRFRTSQLNTMTGEMDFTSSTTLRSSTRKKTGRKRANNNEEPSGIYSDEEDDYDDNSGDDSDEEEFQEELWKAQYQDYILKDGLDSGARNTMGLNKPKHYEFITYEWTISILELNGVRKVIKTFCCDYQLSPQEEEEAELYGSEEGSVPIEYELEEGVDPSSVPHVKKNPPPSAQKHLIQPWFWQTFEVEVDDVYPLELVILSGRIVHKELQEYEEFEEDEREDSQTLGGGGTLKKIIVTKSKPPRERELSKLMKNMSIQVKHFESYLHLDHLEEIPVDKLAGHVPFIYPPTKIYFEAYMETPFDELAADSREVYETEQLDRIDWDFIKHGKISEEEKEFKERLRKRDDEIYRQLEEEDERRDKENTLKLWETSHEKGEEPMSEEEKTIKSLHFFGIDY